MAWIINLNHIPCFDSKYGDLGNKNGILMGLSYIWVNYNDLTATSLESWLVRGIIPKWPYFRLVKYYNLPRYMVQLGYL